MRPRSHLDRRRNHRIPTPSGLWVSWKVGDYSLTSRVEDFSVSGAFIASHKTMVPGSRLDLHFSLPEGQIKIQAIVRNVREGLGMGVEFVSMPGKDFELILKVVTRLQG
jgi:hypothetical protein